MKQQFSDIRQLGSTGQQSLIEEKQSESYVSTSLDLEVTVQGERSQAESGGLTKLSSQSS